jgi:hypothetical protein
MYDAGHIRLRLRPRVVERVRIVLRAADGLQDKEIAAELGIQPRESCALAQPVLGWQVVNRIWRGRALDNPQSA